MNNDFRNFSILHEMYFCLQRWKDAGRGWALKPYSSVEPGQSTAAANNPDARRSADCEAPGFPARQF